MNTTGASHTSTETAAEAGGDEAPTTELHSPLVAVAGEHCPECGAHMAGDQRYCLECGARRGEPRLPIMEGLRQRTPEAPAPPAPRRRAISPNGALIAGVGTLLLAMGVGVLIGREGNATTTSGKAGVQVVTVSGGGAASTAATPAVSNTAKAKKKPAQQTAKARPGAVYKQTKLPPPVVKMGSPGSGRGYQHGKFTGNFFGAGQ